MHSCTWIYDVRLHTAGTNDERVFKKQNKECAVTASVRFEHYLCRESLMATYLTFLALLVEHSLVH